MGSWGCRFLLGFWRNSACKLQIEGMQAAGRTDGAGEVQGSKKDGTGRDKI